MSSHHVVRDKQEPALIIANGEACSADLLGQLLEWNPFVLVLDGAIDRVLDMGINPDAVLGDFDSVIDLDTKLVHLPYTKKLYKPDQEFTDLDKGILYLIQEEYPAANIVWATGNRIDHTITNLFNMARYHTKITLCMIDNYSKKYILPKSFEKWYPANTIISLIPCGTVTSIKTSGLAYNLNGESLVLGHKAGSSNHTVADGFVKIEYDSGELFIVENF
ncbi:MAG: thiamine diphosphokinase [Bacteroidota bacterium]|nr:thiamine diphosphokinase [Bacteroidota bacterium]